MTAERWRQIRDIRRPAQRRTIRESDAEHRREVNGTAQVRKLSQATVKRHGNSARVWQRREIARSPEP